MPSNSNGFRITSRPSLMAIVGGVLLSLIAADALAQDLYRVELLFFTPTDPQEREYLSQATVPELPEGELLWSPQGSAMGPKRDLLPAGNLHLAAARNRLEGSGRYDVKFLVGWTEEFPPGHQTPPLLVRVGDPVNGHHPIEGYIQIARQRYLHVTAELYDLDLSPVYGGFGGEDVPLSFRDGQDANTIEGQAVANPQGQFLADGPGPMAGADTNPGGLQAERGMNGGVGPFPAASPPPKVDTWMRETRRMRSGEIHYMGAPTMGLLVYFEPLD